MIIIYNINTTFLAERVSMTSLAQDTRLLQWEERARRVPRTSENRVPAIGW